MWGYNGNAAAPALTGPELLDGMTDEYDPVTKKHTFHAAVPKPATLWAVETACKVNDGWDIKLGGPMGDRKLGSFFGGLGIMGTIATTKWTERLSELSKNVSAVRTGLTDNLTHLSESIWEDPMKWGKWGAAAFAAGTAVYYADQYFTPKVASAEGTDKSAALNDTDGTWTEKELTTAGNTRKKTVRSATGTTQLGARGPIKSGPTQTVPELSDGGDSEASSSTADDDPLTPIALAPLGHHEDGTLALMASQIPLPSDIADSTKDDKTVTTGGGDTFVAPTTSSPSAVLRWLVRAYGADAITSAYNELGRSGVTNSLLSVK